MKIFPLSEGSFTIDATKMFVPFDNEKDELTARARGSLLVEIQPFLVQTSKDLLLLDAGLGYKIDDRLQIHDNIRKAGFKPEDVTKVLLTHLHKDHAGGIANPSQNRFNTNSEVMNFPNALYYLQKRELDYAWSKGAPSFLPDEIEPLMHSHQVRFLHEDKGVIDDYISYEYTGAHSPYHQVFWIKDDNETIFFGGDDAPQLQQMKVRYKTKYDFQAQIAMELRSKWWEQGNAEGWTFLFYHDIQNPVYRRQT
jgi:glyoxylase-like metal-dependent hydrolase (beta-lactamase superfamily II)